MAETDRRIAALIAAEINARVRAGRRRIELLDEGSTVPFVARYRKEATGGLDDTQLRDLAERLAYLRELEARRATILDSIRGAGQADRRAGGADRRRRPARPSWKTSISLTSPSAAPRPTSPASAAWGRLADAILANRRAARRTRPRPMSLGEVADVKAALDGARDILSESFAVNADLVGACAPTCGTHAILRAQVEDGKQEAGAKFSDYFDHAERWANVPSHRALAMLRGRNEGFLALELEVDAETSRSSA